MAKDQPVIFLVDDDELYLLRLKDHLTEKLSFNARIYTYTSGEECLVNLKLEPDIIVLDYYFTPNDSAHDKKLMNGIQLIGHLKELAPDVHMIMLSNETDVEVANMALNEGAKDYIIKYEYAPIQLQYLINNIILKRMYGPRVNYWRWGTIAIGVLMILMIIYLISGGRK
jgi:two-component system response regulator AtoC